MNVFTYGTLMFPDIWGKIVRNEYAYKDAEIHDYKCLKVKNELYPALIRSRIENKVLGRVYLEVNYDDMRRIEDYEGKQYHCIDGVCHVADSDIPLACKIFVWKTEYKSLLSSDPWTKEWFEEKGLKLYRRELNESIF